MKKTSTYSTQTFTESKIRPSSLANIEELEQPLQKYQINRILYSNQKKKKPTTICNNANEPLRSNGE